MTERGWDAVTFEGVRRAQLREQMRLTPAERLRWLEEALRFAVVAGQRRNSRRESARPDEMEAGPQGGQRGRAEGD